MVAFAKILDFSPDDEEAFLEFEAHARDAMKEAVANMSREEDPGSAWLAYMSQVREAAREYAIEGVADYPVVPPIRYEEFQEFDVLVLSATTRLKIRLARRRNGEALLPDTSDREKLKFRVQKLRDQIEEADLPPAKKDALNKKLDELVKEFEGATVSRVRLLAILTAVGALMAGTQDRILKGPETVVAIMDTVHMVIGKEDERRALLDRYRKPLAIEDKSERQGGFNVKPRPKSVREDFSTDLDDEIPF